MEESDSVLSCTTWIISGGGTGWPLGEFYFWGLNCLEPTHLYALPCLKAFWSLRNFLSFLEVSSLLKDSRCSWSDLSFYWKTSMLDNLDALFQISANSTSNFSISFLCSLIKTCIGFTELLVKMSSQLFLKSGVGLWKLEKIWILSPNGQIFSLIYRSRYCICQCNVDLRSITLLMLKNISRVSILFLFIF